MVSNLIVSKVVFTKWRKFRKASGKLPRLCGSDRTPGLGRVATESRSSQGHRASWGIHQVDPCDHFAGDNS